MPDIAAAGSEVCEALGLDPYKVRSIALRFAAGELPTAEVEILAEVEPGAWDVVLSRYTLRPADEES